MAIRTLFTLCIVLFAHTGCAQTPKSASSQPSVERTATTLVSRQNEGDLRVVSFNVYWDAIFSDVEPRNSGEDRICTDQRFARIVRALDADILALQEIRREPQEVATLLNKIAPLSTGTWHAYRGHTNVIASKFPLSMTTAELIPAGQRPVAMALVDLPDDRFKTDIYVVNNHFKCCGGEKNENKRRKQADALATWLYDATHPGDQIDLPSKTPVVVLGDFNTVEGQGPIETILTGQTTHTADYPPRGYSDWDGTPLTDAHPKHNFGESEDYTWRNDNGSYDPARLDYVLYSDSVMTITKKFVLNTTTLTDAQLKRVNLQKLDVCLDDIGRRFDHLPVVVDFNLN